MANRDKVQASNGLLDSESEDEETMFDFQSQDERQIGKHISMLFRWIAMGIIYTIPGPHLLAITCNVHATLDKIGLLFVSRAIGILLGASASHRIIYKLKGYGVLCLSLLAMGVLLSVFSEVTKLSGAVCMMFAIGVAYGVAIEGYSIMDTSCRLYKPGNLNKKALALSLGAAIASAISIPFIKNKTKINHFNKTMSNASVILAGQLRANDFVFPARICPSTIAFDKALPVCTVPLYLLLIAMLYMMCKKSYDLQINQPDSPVVNLIADWRVYGLRFVLFAVMFFYHGSYVIAAIVLFSYIMLGPFDIDAKKSCLLLMMLWFSFAFGLILQQIILLKVTRTERRLGVAFAKSCICFIASILLMKIDNTNGLTLSLFVYMFFMAELGTVVHEALTKQGIVTDILVNKMRQFAEALAEAIFPVSTLSLMYHKGWHALSFTVLVISVMQFLACTVLALCPTGLHRDMLSLNYENLSTTGVEQGNNGKKIRKEIKRLLGGHTDQEVSYVTSEEEVVFDKKRKGR
eukprot:Seg1946.9 transcript_id=Seg1946.9/GoldUCD/mRNA.D3Y31 product="hypothetical protein" protein_id=Seg1946.9/GoldUCD/D3Y31